MTKAPKANAIDVSDPGTRHCTLYTDGETFKIKRGYTAQVTLTKEEMRKALIFFAPYFSNHVFGVVEDIWEDP